MCSEYNDVHKIMLRHVQLRYGHAHICMLFVWASKVLEKDTEHLQFETVQPFLRASVNSKKQTQKHEKERKQPIYFCTF